MNFAHLGPPIPLDLHDIPPVCIRSWAALTDVNHAGEAIVTFHIEYSSTRQCSATLFLNPRTLAITRVSVMIGGEPQECYAPAEMVVPGHMLDLAKTRVREMFHVGFEVGLPT